jgi:hypothetical protein
MSLKDIRSKFRNDLVSLNLREHKDGFAFDNIPNTLLSDSFHVEIESINFLDRSQEAIEVSVDVVLRVFKKGFRDVQKGIDQSLDLIESIIDKVLDLKGFNSNPIVKIDFDSSNINPLGEANDNAIFIETNFNVTAYLCTGLGGN